MKKLISLLSIFLAFSMGSFGTGQKESYIIPDLPIKVTENSLGLVDSSSLVLPETVQTESRINEKIAPGLQSVTPSGSNLHLAYKVRFDD